MLNRYLLVGLLAVVGCKKEDKAPPADKPADPVAAKPTDPGSAAPAADPGTPGSAAPGSAAPAADPGSAAAAPAEPAALTWEKFTSKEGGFSMEFPTKPEERDQGGMKIVGAEFGTTAADSRTAMCGATHMKLPGDAKLDIKAMLDGAVARHKQNAKVIEEKDVKIGKHPGRSIVVENDSHRKWMRVFVVDRTLYVLTCGGPFDRADKDGPIATKTLDSFALVK